MSDSTLVLVLDDQLSPASPALADALPGRDTNVMVEVRAEAEYARHHRHKIALLFSATRIAVKVGPWANLPRR